MTRTIWMIVAGLAAMVLVSACGAATGSPTAGPAAAPAVTPDAVYPVAGTPPPKATAAPVYPVTLDGKALVSERCTVCHDTGRIQSARKSTADWQSTVTRMKSNGARLNDAETAAVIAYLAATYR